MPWEPVLWSLCSQATRMRLHAHTRARTHAAKPVALQTKVHKPHAEAQARSSQAAPWGCVCGRSVAWAHACISAQVHARVRVCLHAAWATLPGRTWSARCIQNIKHNLQDFD